MPSVINAFAHAMADAAGLTLTDEGQLLDGGSVLYSMPSTITAKITDTDYFDLIDCIQEQQSDNVVLVARYASAIQVDDLGLLGLAIKTAPTLRTSLLRVQNYFRLITDTAVYTLDETNDGAWFVFQGQTAHRAALELRTECALAGFITNLRRIVQGTVRIDAVTFSHSCRCDRARYEAFFGCPVVFDAPQNAIVFDVRCLELKNQLSDAAVSDYLSKHLDLELQINVPTPTFGATLLHHLTPKLSDGMPQAADVARELGMSERTLYRRLSDEGLTFRDVLAEAQSKLAQGLLKDDTVSIAEIAFMTGFSEQSTFSRAFKRWVGQAPAQFRQQAVTG
ncbi:MAG: AraC family transcriptional regulator [Shimia sp.]|nr:AraC family transcriptional regulator [Shimia sp.]